MLNQKIELMERMVLLNLIPCCFLPESLSSMQILSGTLPMFPVYGC